MAITRRTLITSALGLIAAPTIVRVASLMPVRALTAPSLVLGVDVGLETPMVGLCLARRAGETVAYIHMLGWYNSYVAMMKAAAEAAIQREPYRGPMVAEIPHDDH